MNTPLVTVITSYYNDQAFLKDAIDSVLAQTYKNWELILINHASTDNSRDIAHSYKDARIKHIDLHQNYGATGNFLVQTGLKNANGEFIKFLSADDILKPNALNILLQAALTNQADLVFGNLEFIDIQKNLLGKNWFEHHYPILGDEIAYLQVLLQGINPLPFPGNFIRKNVIEQIHLDCSIILNADMCNWAEILLNGGKLCFVKEPVVLYRIHSGQMCSVHAYDNIIKRSAFEAVRFIKVFLQSSLSVNKIKELLPLDPYAQLLTETDSLLVPFVLAHHVAYHTKNIFYRWSARLALADILDNPVLRAEIEQKFSFSIKNIRQEITENPIYLSHNPPIREASFSTLGYYFFRKLFSIILLRDYRHKKQFSKKKVV